MATTIITKNGSGAPLAGDLTAGELAVDLTNKRLYSKDSGGNVIELGTNAGSSTFADLTVTGDLTVDTDTLYVDSTNNRVGIGESSPNGLLHLKSTAPDLILEDSGSASAIGSSNRVRFRNSTGTYSAQIGNDPSKDGGQNFTLGTLVAYPVGIMTNGSTRMTIDSSGNVGIGDDSPSSISSNATTLTIKGQVTTKAGALYLQSSDESLKSYIYQDSGNGMTIAAQSGSQSIRFLTGTESMRIDSSGNVGIGETNPLLPLHIKRVGTSGTVLLESKNSAGTLRGHTAVIAGTTSCGILRTGGKAFNFWTQPIADIGTETNLSPDMTLDSGGNLLVGTTSPVRKLTVEDSAQVVQYLKSTNAGNACYIEFNNAGSGSNVCRVGSGGGSLLFASGNGTTKATLDSSGNLLVGATSGVDFKQKVVQPANYGICTLQNTLTSGLTYDQFQVNVSHAASSAFYLMRTYAGGTPQFAVTGNGVIYAQNTSVQSISDGRVKENVRDSEQGLDVITALRPVRFDFKEGFGNDQKNQLGFIAQEVEAVFPDAVMEASEKTEREEPLKSLGPAALIPVMVKAIQELSGQVDELKAEVAALKGA